MARLIDAEVLLEDNTWEWFDEWGNYTSAGQAIADAPTVDAVEVVRCKDCRFSDCRQSFREGETYCTISCLLVGNNEYCSNGAKMDGGDE